MIQLRRGDCLELMKDIPDGSVDMILADLPYGTTACKWDTIIPFEPLWDQYKCIIKPNGAIVLTASQPFTSALVMSNPKMFRHAWVWNKSVGSNLFQAKIAPLKVHEDVLVFSIATVGYIPQMTPKDKPQKQGSYKNLSNSSEVTNKKGKQALAGKIYTESYPKTILEFKKENRSKKPLHPTQKPVALFEYLIKTYTNEGEVVLDNTMGSGTTGVACVNTNRNFIGMELDDKYFEIAKERIEKAIAEKANFLSF